MKVLLNEAGYVESYALEGDMVGAVECDAPTNLAMFEKNFTACLCGHRLHHRRDVCHCRQEPIQ